MAWQRSRLSKWFNTAVGEYFHRYDEVNDWQLGLGTIEGQPAILVYGAGEAPMQPVYFILLTWDNQRVSLIRDYRYVPYIMRDAAIIQESLAP